jgi:uncharacterized protein (DUF2267 family)
MRDAYLGALDHAMQVTNEWVHQIDELMPWEKNYNKSFRLLRATLHAIRDLLGTDEIAQLSAQLPQYLRGVYFEGWEPNKTPSKQREKADFLASIAEQFAPDVLDDPEQAVNAVLSVLNTRVSAGEITDVRNAMRKSIRDLWPEPRGGR